MHFSTLVALAVVASFVPSLAAPTPYFPRRVTSEHNPALMGVNALPDSFVRNGSVQPSIGTVILPGANLSPSSKRDTNFDIVQAIEAAFNELPPARKRDITADITAVLQTLLQESGSVLSDIIKRDSASSYFEDRSFKVPKVNPSVTEVLEGAGNVVSIGGGLAEIWDLVDGKNSTRRDLSQNFDGVDGPGLRFEDRSFKSHSSVGSALKTGAEIVGAGDTAWSILSALDGSGNSTKRDLGIDSGRISGQKRAIFSDIESIIQLIISSFEGAGSASASTPTSTKRFTSNDGFLALIDSIIPEKLDELN